MNFYIKRRKRLFKRLLVGITIFLVGIGTLFFLSFLSERYLSMSWVSHPVFWVFLMTLISISAYKPLDFMYTEFFKRILFKKKSYINITLLHLAEELRLVLDLQEMANMVVNTFGEILHLKTVAFLVPDIKNQGFEINAAYGWHVSDYRRVYLLKDISLVHLIQSGGSHIVMRNAALRTQSWQEANRLAQDFDTLQAGWIIPLFLGEELCGMIAFSALERDRAFDKSDFQLFREFAFSMAKNLRNALNVREFKTTIQELQDVQSKLMQATKLHAIEQLATGIAHEIHNPLTIISGKAQVLLLQKDRTHLDERVEEVLKTIVKQTKRAADITRKLLMFSQSSGAPREWLHLEQVLHDTLALVSYQSTLEGIEIVQSVGRGIPPFYANVHELREVFLNLILNAVQSIGSQGKIQVEIQFLAKDGLIEIQISDTGQGIEAACIEKLFNPFFTTRDNALGLGLFVTKQIVHRYGGAIRVESRYGEGSLFIISFPASEAVSGRAAEKSPSAIPFHEVK